MVRSSGVSTERSPRYPRFPLMPAIGYARRLYDGAHRSITDTVTAYKVMGFAGKSGASATALGSVKQFGLVESVRGGIRISDLALQILEPSSQEEYVHALHVAADQPQVFKEILSQFDDLPRSDEPIRSYLIRSLGFSKSGADDCISSIRETFSQLPELESDISPLSEDVGAKPSVKPVLPEEVVASSRAKDLNGEPVSGHLRIPLTRECSAELKFQGTLTAVALDRFIRHIELMREVWAED